MERFTDLREKVWPILAPYVKSVAVFGSYARGEERESSDIDLLVELKSPQERPPLGLRWFALEDELSQLLGRSVELIAADGLSPHLKPYIEGEKVMLHEEG